MGDMYLRPVSDINSDINFRSSILDYGVCSRRVCDWCSCDK
jgi:hypothetical protein